MPTKQRNSVPADPFLLKILSQDIDFKLLSNFDCGDSDLNDFFQKDALAHHKELFATTYILKLQEMDEQSSLPPIAAISFNNDLIKLSNIDKDKFLPEAKAKYKYSPAVKIARLGVFKSYQNKNLGTYILNLTKQLFVTDNRTGCRFLTVDAYNKPNVIRFYRKNDFSFLHDKDQKRQTRIMYFDLKRFIDNAI